MPNNKKTTKRTSAPKKAVKTTARKASKPQARMKASGKKMKISAPKASKKALKAVSKMVKGKVAAPKAPAEPSKKANRSIMPPDVVKREIETLLANEKVNEYLKRNVSKTAIDILTMLSSPKTDEHLAEQLGLKINAIRRILNIMQGYGITNYYVSKNTKGWLSFAWYVNTTKLNQFLEVVNSAEQENAVINTGCNDYFLCNDCYKSDNLLYTFDAAYETSFKCNCGKNLARMDKSEAETMLNAAR
jgi:transcription initiation factor IIE alpha subunit